MITGVTYGPSFIIATLRWLIVGDLSGALKLVLMIDRKTFVEELKRIGRIRNDVMHFDPDGPKEVSIKPDLVFPLNEKIGRILVFKRFRPPRIMSPAIPVILPPVINKKIVFKELESIWRDAWLALRHSSEIYVIGYSLPPEDLHARFTIRSAIRGNEKFEQHKPTIAMVNPDRNVYLRFARLVNASVKYYESGLQEISLQELVGS